MWSRPRTAQTWPPGCSDLDARVVEDLAQERLDVRGVDPGGAEAGVDLAGGQVGREDLAQRGDVHGEPGVVPGGCLGGAQPGAHVAGQVLRGGQQPPGLRGR